MTGEFYHLLHPLLSTYKAIFYAQWTLNKLLQDAPPYISQRNLNDLDAIITYNRAVRAAKGKANKTFLTTLQQVSKY